MSRNLSPSSTESIFSELFKELNAIGEPYCVWGGHSKLPKELSGSDVDIIVKNISSQLIKVLYNLGFVISRSAIYGGTPIVFVRYVGHEMKWIPLHIITPVLPSGHRITPDNFEKYCKMSGGMKLAGPEFETLILLSHGFSKQKTTQKRLIRINNNLKRTDFDMSLFKAIFQNLLGNNDDHLTTILNGDSASLFNNETVCRDLANRLLICGKKEGKWREIGGKIRKKIGGAKKRLRIAVKHRGKIVAITGIDGSGKSTFIKKYKIKSENHPSLFIEMSMSTLYLPHTLSQPIRRSILYFSSKAQKMRIWKNFAFVLSQIQILFDYIGLLYLYSRARTITLKGTNVVFDRYAIDHVNKKINSKKTTQILTKLAFIKLFPKPDILIYFDIPPKKSLERKQEDSYEQLMAKYTSYNKIFLQYKISNTFIRIDASKTVEEVHDQLISSCWRDLTGI